MRTWMALGWAPAAMARATLVWRRSWKRQSTPAFAFASFQKWVWKLEWISGVPVVVWNTSVSGPGSRSARSSLSIAAVLDEIVIERMPADVFGSVRCQVPSLRWMRLGEGDAFAPGEDRHRAQLHPRWAHLDARVLRDAITLDGELEEAAQGAVVTVHRGRGEPEVELVGEP